MKFYFYHLVNKNADLSKGYLSKNQNRLSEGLSSEEIMDDLNLFRGEEVFFWYSPYKALGLHMSEILDFKVSIVLI